MTKYANSNIEQLGHEIEIKHFVEIDGSVPDPDPPDPNVFGPPGSGSTIQMYGSGSGSFYHEAKKVKKTFDSYCFVTSFGLFEK